MLRTAQKHAKKAAASAALKQPATTHFRLTSHQPFFTSSLFNARRRDKSRQGCIDWQQRNTFNDFFEFQQQRRGILYELEDEVEKVDPVAKQMIQYGIGLAREQKTIDSYAQGLLVLEQCLSSAGNENTKGVVLLAMSTLLSERGDLDDAMEKLEAIRKLGSSHLGVRVAAVEGLIGLCMEMGQDGVASLLAGTCSELLKPNPEDNQTISDELQGFQVRVNAIRGLVELLLGCVEKAGKWFEEIPEQKYCLGNVMLSHGEFLHATGNFALAKGYYEKAIEATSETDSFSDLDTLAACNLVPMEVRLGAICALGQLEAHSGNFNDAEEILTKALTKAEEDFGSHHPKVGVVLTCIALMYRSKAKLERSSSLLIQEGLYRKAIDMLKAPSLETEGAESKVERSDIVALARGAYADILSVQQNRKAEGERMRDWAEKAWRNRRLTLAEALEISEPSKVAVVDTRISRVL